MYKIIFYITVFLKCNLLFAQEEQFNIKFFGVTNGLTSGNIRKIVQDNYGFIWIGTQDGLFRYDSRNFISYNALSTNNHRLCGQDVRCLVLDSANHLLWVTTSYGGINAIDLITGNVIKNIYQSDFSPLKNNLIKTFAVFNDMILLGCERGLFKLQLAENKLTYISDALGKPADDYIDIITKIGTGKVIVLSRVREPFIFDAMQDKIMTGQSFPPISILHDTAFRYLDCSIGHDGVVCITSTQSVKFYNLGNGFLLTPFKNSLNTQFKQRNLVVRRCVEDKNGEYWMATNEGLFRSNLNNLSYVRPNSQIDFGSSWLNAIYSIYIDQSNNVWLGCQDGLAFVNSQQPAFISTSYSNTTNTKINHAYYLFPVDDSIIYSTAEEGLYKINRKKNEIVQLAKSVSFDFIFSDPFKRFIVSNLNGLFVLNGNRLLPIQKIYDEFTNLHTIRINSMITLNDSCLAFGTENDKGVLIWNYKKRMVHQFDTHSAAIRLVENTVNTVYLIKKDEFLILSDASFSLFNYGDGTLKKIDLYEKRPNDPLNIFFDVCRVKDTFFVACYGHGVVKLDKHYKIVGAINSSNGLSNNGVYKILPWHDSLLFITTNNGLNLYDIGTGSIRKFYKDNGLTDNSFEETSGNIYKTEIFAGGTGGFTTIIPERIKVDSVAPLVYIDGITIEKNGNYQKDTFNLFPAAISIPNDANQATISFSAITFNNPDHVKLFYRFRELQNNWIEIGSQNFINLIGFSPGNYTLQVVAENGDGYRSRIRELAITFIPKWYQTTLFKIFGLVLVILFFYAIYRYRFSQLKKQEQIRSDIASDLHDDIGSTLNSVKIYVHLLETSADQRQTIISLKDSLSQATAGLRDMIWVLDDKRDTIEELITRLQQFVVPVAAATGVKVTFSADNLAKFELNKAEKRNLLLIAKEAITNSIKYSGCQSIEISLTKTNGKLMLIIRDDGKGFDEREIKPGDGLKNMRQRAKQIHFNIILDSVKGDGTKIMIAKK